MLPSTQESYSAHPYEIQTYKSTFYSNYPATKNADERIHWRRKLWRIGVYVRLVILGTIMVIVGGIFPLMVSYEFFFKAILTNACTSCTTPDIKNFVFNYGIGSMLAVMGLLMPLLVLVIFINIIRSQSFLHEMMN